MGILIVGVPAVLQSSKQIADEGSPTFDSDELMIRSHHRVPQQAVLRRAHPQYRQMLGLFTERYHFADAETREFYPLFLEYVEVWNMWLAESISAEVVKAIDHRDENVKPFYEHLERKMQQLQDEIARG